MSTRFVMLDTIAKVEEKTTRQWVRGVGKEAEFLEGSNGWWAAFKSCPASIHLGATKPGLQAGDKVRIILEKVG